MLYYVLHTHEKSCITEFDVALQAHNWEFF